MRTHLHSNEDPPIRYNWHLQRDLFASQRQALMVWSRWTNSYHRVATIEELNPAGFVAIRTRGPELRSLPTESLNEFVERLLPDLAAGVPQEHGRPDEQTLNLF